MKVKVEVEVEALIYQAAIGGSNCREMKIKKPYSLSNYDKACLERVKTSIEDNPASVHTIKNLSASAGINRNKLNYGFKKLFGSSIHQFVIRTRMEKAKQMLSESELPIKAIAQLAGYRNTKSFITAFKKLSGLPPSQFVKKMGLRQARGWWGMGDG